MPPRTTRGVARGRRQSWPTCPNWSSDLAGNAQHFVERGQSGLGLEQASTSQRLHAFAESKVFDEFGAGVDEDLLAHGVGDRQNFQNREPAEETGFLIARTAVTPVKLLAFD